MILMIHTLGSWETVILARPPRSHAVYGRAQLLRPSLSIHRRNYADREGFYGLRL